MDGARRRGLSLVEATVSIAILFLVGLFLVELFLSGVSAGRRSQDFSIAALLAQKEMEETIYQNAACIYAVGGPCPSPFSDFRYIIDPQPYLPQVMMVNIDVLGPHGVHAHLAGLKGSQLWFAGIADDVYSNVVDFVKWDRSLSYYVQSSSSLTTAGNLPAGGIATGVAVDSTTSTMWVGDSHNNALWYTLGGSWTGPLAPPAGMGAAAGVATDAASTVVFVADQTNRCLWYFNSNTRAWRGPITTPGLGVPMGLATDANAATVWVADSTNNCVRYYNDDTAAWSPIHYGAGVLSSPRGVAVPTLAANICYVVDATSLWMIDGDSGTVTLQMTMPVGAVPNGLATDAGGNTVWVSDTTNKVIYYARIGGAITTVPAP